VKNRFQNLPFKCNLQRYNGKDDINLWPNLPRSWSLFKPAVLMYGEAVPRVDSPDPSLKGARYPSGFNHRT
jgi:hypothetical protein